jgi:uncharacterized membrane protein
MLIFAIVIIVSIGLMIGTEFAVSAFINPILWKLEEPARTEAVRLFGKKLGTVMPFWYSGNFLLLLAETFLQRGRPAIGPLGAASGIWAAVIVLTLIFLVPINNRLVRADAGIALDQAHREQQRWDARHRARVVALIVAFVLILIGLRG